MRVAEVYAKAKSLRNKIMCVYAITNLNNGHRYIGSAVNLKKRISGHLSRLEKGTHVNSKLQNAWNKNGEDVFVFGVLSSVNQRENLVPIEQSWLDGYKPEYNIATSASAPMLGRKFSEESLMRLTQASTGRKHTEDSKRKISQSNLGRKWSKPFTSEHRAKIKAGNSWYSHSPEMRALISSKLTGRVFTPEWRAKLKAAKILNPPMLGKKHSEAAKLKCKLAWQRRRELKQCA